MPSGDEGYSHLRKPFRVTYYKAGSHAHPIVYVQERDSWWVYVPGEPMRQSAGTIPSGLLGLCEEITQREAEGLLMERLAPVEVAAQEPGKTAVQTPAEVSDRQPVEDDGRPGEGDGQPGEGDALQPVEATSQRPAETSDQGSADAAEPVMRPTEKEFRRPPSVDTPAEPQPRRAGLRFLLAPVAGLAVFFGTVLAMSAVVAPLVELTSVGAVALTSLRAIALPTLLGTFVFTLVLGPESAWSFRLGLRLGFWFGLGTLLLNVVIDLPIDTQGPVFHAINLEGSDQWLCLALVVLPYLVIGVIGGLAAATVGRATERKRHTAQVSGVRSWQIGLGLTGAVVVLALVATLLSSSWSSAWDPLYGSGGDPEDWTDAQALVGQANAAKETGDTQGALELYARAIGTEPLFTPGWRERILVLGTERRFEEALSSAGGWIATLPGDSTAWYYKGCALEALGHHEDAIKAYEQAMSAAAQSQASGAETAATLAIRLAHCNEVLADPGLATREEYFREMATFLEGIGKVDRWVSAIVDAGTSDAAASLLSDFASRLNESIDPALEIEPPAELETTHQELVDGLLALKRGASGMLAALQNGDSSAYSESRGTLLVGSQAIDTFERLIPNPFEG